MFISVHIRGPVQLVRRRTGEEVSNPIHEFEDGGIYDDHSAEFDLRHRIIDRTPIQLEPADLHVDLEIEASDEKLVAATGAFSRDSNQERRDLEQERDRRGDLNQPFGLRRMLSKLYELSMLARPAKHTFVQHMDNGIAKATFRVWRGTLTIGASVQTFDGMTSHLTRGEDGHRTGARLRGVGQVNPDGSIDDLRLDVQLDELPTLGPLEQAELARLKGSFIRTHENGMAADTERAWSEAHHASARRRPDMPLMLLVTLLNDLERQAMGLLGGATPTTTLASITLHDVLDTAEATDGKTERDADLHEQTRLTWLDENTPVLDIPGCGSDQLAAVNEAFRRIMAYLPKAWAPRLAPAQPTH